MKWRAALKYQGLFDEWEVRTAEEAVSRFCGPGRAFPADERDALLHELLTGWYFERGKFEPGRGVSRETYMRVVVERDLLDRVKEVEAGKRRVLSEARALDAPLGSENDALALHETLGDEREPLAKGDFDRRLDVAKALQQLSDRQRQVAELLLNGTTIVGVAEALGTSRSTVYDEIIRIRKIFGAKGLRDYLK